MVKGVSAICSGESSARLRHEIKKLENFDPLLTIMVGAHDLLNAIEHTEPV